MLLVKKKLITTPLRYPGGKSKALNQIVPMIPEFEEFREPFVGGGSVFIYLKQNYSDKKFWINDFNYDLYCLWSQSQNNIQNLISEINKTKNSFIDGRQLYNFLMEQRNEDEISRAVRFFILNRITFSGTVDSGGYSKKAFEGRFTDSSIKRLELVESVIKDTHITNLDYEDLLNKDGKDVFVFLDPPYLSSKKSKLYGKNGSLHVNFDHERFANAVKNCKHKWLITYDDSPEIRKLFSFAKMKEWDLQYAMNNVNSDSANIGKELFIYNY